MFCANSDAMGHFVQQSPTWHVASHSSVPTLELCKVRSNCWGKGFRQWICSIIVSICDASLRLRLYTPTLISASHRHIVIIPMGFRGVYPERSCFPYHRWNTTSYRTCISLQHLYIWELCRCALTTRTSAILAYSALSMSSLDNTTARDI